MIHFAYSVPRWSSRWLRGLEKISTLSRGKIPPLYRTGNRRLIPWRSPVRAPHSISLHLLESLGAMGTLRFYNMYEKVPIALGAQDIFVGAPVPKNGFEHDGKPTHDDEQSVTSHALRKNPLNHRKFLITPFADHPRLMSWTRDLIKNHADGVILIGGEVWKKNWSRGVYADIDANKFLHVSMCIDPGSYPHVKETFNAPGKRGYLYIGHTGWYKNTEELVRIARSMPDCRFGHIGLGSVPGWNKISDFVDMTPEFMRAIASEYDIFVTTSTADAQATTVLEQMLFGMSIACTPETGYEYDSFTHLSTSDTDRNVDALKKLQYAPEEELRHHARQNRVYALQFHNWNDFCHAITKFIHEKSAYPEKKPR